MTIQERETDFFSICTPIFKLKKKLWNSRVVVKIKKRVLLCMTPCIQAS